MVLYQFLISAHTRNISPMLGKHKLALSMSEQLVFFWLHFALLEDASVISLVWQKCLSH